LQELWVNDNQIGKIENLSSSLQILYLCNNQIEKIENLPNSLLELWMDRNRIMKIKNLPNGLQILSVKYNRITELSLSLLESRHLTRFYHIGNPIKNLKHYNFKNNPLVLDNNQKK